VWPTVGAGLHLLSLAYAGTVARASLAAMTEVPNTRELAEIPAVEVITRSAVMLMSAAAEKLGRQTTPTTVRIGISTRRAD
jgi:hypothetical protein